MLAALLAFLFAACEKPDASDVTSPSGRTLLGTTAGTAAYDVDQMPPAASSDPDGWEFELLNARYSKLENFDVSLQVVTRTRALAGTTMEAWLWNEGGHVPLYWKGGTTTSYNGVFCFQFRFEDGDESLHIEDAQYYLTIGFRDQESGEWVVVKEERVAGTIPELNGEPPGEDSRVGRDLLGCPRSVI